MQLLPTTILDEPHTLGYVNGHIVLRDMDGTQLKHLVKTAFDLYDDAEKIQLSIGSDAVCNMDRKMLDGDFDHRLMLAFIESEIPLSPEQDITGRIALVTTVDEI